MLALEPHARRGCTFWKSNVSKSRRDFLVTSGAMLASAAAAAEEQSPAPGTPPAFGTAPAVGPEVTSATFAAAEKLVRGGRAEAGRAGAAAGGRGGRAARDE